MRGTASLGEEDHTTYLPSPPGPAGAGADVTGAMGAGADGVDAGGAGGGANEGDGAVIPVLLDAAGAGLDSRAGASALRSRPTSPLPL